VRQLLCVFGRTNTHRRIACTSARAPHLVDGGDHLHAQLQLGVVIAAALLPLLLLLLLLWLWWRVYLLLLLLLCCCRLPASGCARERRAGGVGRRAACQGVGDACSAVRAPELLVVNALLCARPMRPAAAGCTTSLMPRAAQHGAG
jgi:hypothetical protein